MKVYNSTQNNLIAENLELANTPIRRMLGLILKKNISANEGLIIKPCFGVHTWFMKFSIDILFVDKNNKIVALYENVGKNQILPMHFNSFYVIELSAGKIEAKGIKSGDAIQILA